MISQRVSGTHALLYADAVIVAVGTIEKAVNSDRNAAVNLDSFLNCFIRL